MIFWFMIFRITMEFLDFRPEISLKPHQKLSMFVCERPVAMAVLHAKTKPAFIFVLMTIYISLLLISDENMCHANVNYKISLIYHSGDNSRMNKHQFLS